MKQHFHVVASWIERSGAPAFNPPASDAQIADAERRFGAAFPPPLRDLYRLTNGQPSGAVALEGSFTFLSLEQVVETTRFLNEEFPDGVNVHALDDAPLDVDAGIRATWWWRGWIPFMENGGGDYICADLDPAAEGAVGQVIIYYHDEMFRPLVAPGIDALMAGLAARIASGRCRIVDGMIEEV